VGTTGPKIHLNDSLCLQILWVKRDFPLLLLSIRFNQERIAKVIVMKMKCRFVVPVVIGLDDLSIGDFCILDQYVYIRAAFTICSAYDPFDRKPMVSFVRRRNNRRETTHYRNG
jgi:hypothetical protein